MSKYLAKWREVRYFVRNNFPMKPLGLETKQDYTKKLKINKHEKTIECGAVVADGFVADDGCQ